MTTSVECIIKLGGSAITNKNEFESCNFEAIKQTAQLISLINGNCIVVHGAGSFGHFQAREHGVSHGFHGSTEEERRRKKQGFSETRLSVIKLNHIVTREFVMQGIPAVSVSPCGSWKTVNRKVESCDLSQVTSLLEHGFVPILHGDCVIDSRLGCTILSGDTIIETLCERLHPERVIFLTDVNGIYDKPPEEKDACLLTHIHVNQEGQLSIPIATSAAQHDVTGGIAFKLKTAVSIVTKSEGSISVFICNIESGESACVHGYIDDGVGTTVLYRKDLA